MEFLKKILERTTINDRYNACKDTITNEWRDNKYFRFGAITTTLSISILLTRAYLRNTKSIDKYEYEIITHDKLIEKIKLKAQNSGNNGNDIKEDITDDDTKESMEIQEKLEKDKYRLKRILTSMVLIDIGLSCLLGLPYHELRIGKTQWNDIFCWKRIYNFKGDSFDCFIGSILRISVFIGMVNLNILWGNVEHYKEIHVRDKNTGVTKEIAVWNGLKAKCVILDQIVSVFGSFGRLVFGSIQERLNNELMKEEQMDVLLQEEMSRHQSVLVVDDKNQIRKSMDADEIIQRFSGVTDIYELSKMYKSIVWIGLFATLTVFQSYMGIKLVFFDGFKSRRNNDKTLMKSIGICSSIIVLSHLEVYYAGKYIDSSCEPKNKFFNDKIHTHPVFKRKKTKSTWCKLCWSKITSTHYHCPRMLINIVLQYILHIFILVFLYWKHII